MLARDYPFEARRTKDTNSMQAKVETQILNSQKRIAMVMPMAKVSSGVL